MTEQTKTPRTAAAVCGKELQSEFAPDEVVDADFARQLETELAAAIRAHDLSIYESAATMICPKCGADRLKEICRIPSRPTECPMVGTAFSATPESITSTEASDLSTEALGAHGAADPDVAGLIERLNGRYTVPVNDGAGLLDGKDTFSRTFPVPPIQIEAAAALQRQADQLAEVRKDAERYRWLREQNKDPVYADCVVINWNVGHDWTTTNDLDAAIDAALSEGKP